MSPLPLRVVSALLLIPLASLGCRSRSTDRITPDPPSAITIASNAAPTAAPSSSALAATMPAPSPSASSPDPDEPPRTRFVDGGPPYPPFEADAAVHAGWPRGYIPDRVRERATVSIDGARETWSLVWTTLPVPECIGFEDTCPCFELGDAEAGELELWRERPGKKTEVRILTGFGHQENLPPQIALPKFPADTPFTAAGLKRARRVPVLTIGDYNHDGISAEFPLPGMYLSTCDDRDRITVLIGVTRDRPTLHAIGGAHTPDRPIVFGSRRDWERVRAAVNSVDVNMKDCSVMGGQETFELTFGPNGLEGRYAEYDCDLTKKVPERPGIYERAALTSTRPL